MTVIIRTGADERFYIESTWRIQSSGLPPEQVFAQQRAEVQYFNTALNNPEFKQTATNALLAIDPSLERTTAAAHVENVFNVRRLAQQRLIALLDDEAFRAEVIERSQQPLEPRVPFRTEGFERLLPEEYNALMLRYRTMAKQGHERERLAIDQAQQTNALRLFECSPNPVLLAPLTQALMQAGSQANEAAELAESFLSNRYYEAQARLKMMQPDGPIMHQIMTNEAARPNAVPQR
ncbi:MAG: hypothetical protein ACKVOE_07370 [Rickettsiales bacterium]